jgi:hypothetical protein
MRDSHTDFPYFVCNGAAHFPATDLQVRARQKRARPRMRCGAICRWKSIDIYITNKRMENYSQKNWNLEKKR